MKITRFRIMGMSMIKAKALLLLIIGAHYVVFISFVLSGLLSFLYLPWFMAITLSSIVVRTVFDPYECPLTSLENNQRVLLGLALSRGFLKDYIIYPRRTFKYLLSKLK